MTRPLALAASALLAATAAGQTFTLIQTDNLDLLCDDPSGNDLFWIGNNPSAIAFDGANAYVAGFNNGTCPWVQIVKIEDILGQRQFRPLIDQSDPLNPNQDLNISSRRVANGSRGYNGMDFVPGAGLVASIDLEGFGVVGQFQTWDVETQLNPIALTTAQSGASPRGIAGPSWDLGYDGAGFTWDLGGGDTGDDDPVVAALDFSSDPRGPLGLSPNTLSGAIGATVYEVDTGGPQLDGGGLSGTIWRDIDIDPNTGTIAARAANDLVIARRATDNTVASKVVVDGGDAPFVVGQQVTIVHGLCGGDVVVYNDRPDGAARAFLDVIKVVDLDGNPVGASFENPDGTPVTLPVGVGFYDFAWDQATGLLLVLDFGNRNIYFFDTPANADFNGDGVVNSQDFVAFLNAFTAGDPSADFNGDDIINSQDFVAFLNAFVAGC
jgi:hypothetical protein